MESPRAAHVRDSAEGATYTHLLELSGSIIDDSNSNAVCRHSANRTVDDFNTDSGNEDDVQEGYSDYSCSSCSSYSSSGEDSHSSAGGAAPVSVTKKGRFDVGKGSGAASGVPAAALGSSHSPSFRLGLPPPRPTTGSVCLPPAGRCSAEAPVKGTGERRRSSCSSSDDGTDNGTDSMSEHRQLVAPDGGGGGADPTQHGTSAAHASDDDDEGVGGGENDMWEETTETTETELSVTVVSEPLTECEGTGEGEEEAEKRESYGMRHCGESEGSAGNVIDAGAERIVCLDRLPHRTSVGAAAPLTTPTTAPPNRNGPQPPPSAAPAAYMEAYDAVMCARRGAACLRESVADGGAGDKYWRATTIDTPRSSPSDNNCPPQAGSMKDAARATNATQALGEGRLSDASSAAWREHYGRSLPAAARDGWRREVCAALRPHARELLLALAAVSSAEVQKAAEMTCAAASRGSSTTTMEEGEDGEAVGKMSSGSCVKRGTGWVDAYAAAHGMKSEEKEREELVSRVNAARGGRSIKVNKAPTCVEAQRQEQKRIEESAETPPEGTITPASAAEVVNALLEKYGDRRHRASAALCADIVSSSSFLSVAPADASRAAQDGFVPQRIEYCEFVSCIMTT